MYENDVFYQPQHSEILPNGFLRVPVIEIGEDGTETESQRTIGPEFPMFALWSCLLREGRQDIDLFNDSGFENGVLSFTVGLYTYIDLDFTPRDWDALFLKTLGCPAFDPCREEETSNECHERNRRMFQSAISEYPLLGRIFDFYEDAKYTKEEIAVLRAECERAKTKVTERYGLHAVRKLLYACDKALGVKGGLRLVCD